MHNLFIYSNIAHCVLRESASELAPSLSFAEKIQIARNV